MQAQLTKKQTDQSSGKKYKNIFTFSGVFIQLTNWTNLMEKLFFYTPIFSCNNTASLLKGRFNEVNKYHIAPRFVCP